MKSDRKQRRKKWHEDQARKQLMQLGKRHSRKKKISAKPTIYKVKRPQNGNFSVTAPTHFSLFENNTETLKFFNDVMENFAACQSRDTVFFDLSQIKVISVDAIMYLIALLKNTLRINQFKIKCSGNEPEESKARAIMIDSGFYDYVTPVQRHRTNHHKRQTGILGGADVNSDLAKKICDFVNGISEKTALNTKRLYPMILELMANTKQHAYGKQRSHLSKCNGTGEFLDTGLGIPKTIYRHIPEKLRDLLREKDARYLDSVLRGVFRTETRAQHRGKGLPGIYQDVCDHAFSDFSLISGKEMCSVMNDGTIQTTDLAYEFQGTLFIWTVEK